MTDSPLADHFGRNLWRCRRRAGLSQEELAELAELHRTEIGGFEQGKRLPRLDTLLKVTAAVDASPRDLLTGLHWRPGRYLEGDFRVEDGLEWAGRPRVKR